MSKYIYIINEHTRLQDTTASRCVRAFENLEDANKHFSFLNDETSDKSGVWFDIQLCELEEGKDDRDE